VTTEKQLEAQLEVFERGAVDLIDRAELSRKIAASLKSGKPLRVKFGMDPSSPDLHLGHAVHLMKLRDMQELGHQVVLIVGDATAMVGDPSGRNKLRPTLTREQVQANMETYTSQAALVLDMERTEVRYNFEWFGKMGFSEILTLCGRMTVARMLERDTFEKRMKDGEAIGIHEFLYPLMQGWDSVEIRSDVELGATDQLFNILSARQLQEQEQQAPQICLTHPLIMGTDGRKMSKSYGNAIGLTDEPGDMFGKVMSIDDESMETWFTYLTRVPTAELPALLAGHPREAKARLAREITAFYHGAEAATAAAEGFDRQFRDKQLPDDIPEVAFPGEWQADGVPLAILLREVKLAASSSEARRLIQQGGVKVDGEVMREPSAQLAPPAEALLIQVGKRRFARVRKS